ncbi:MAG: ATPase-like protein [Actinomycetia bacterium]|nr:ATPase-like protein [Actinomycetes bacterium]
MTYLCCRSEVGELASAPEGAWLRLWTQTLLLGFLSGRPLPLVPDTLRIIWGQLDARRRDAVLEVVAERSVASRAPALRASYPPGVLVAVLSQVARDLLDGRAAPARAGRAWVPPQLRWAHEADRAGWQRPVAGQVAGWELAPPLDFALAGLPDWPGMRAADRLALLLRHPLALSDSRNRLLAAAAVFGVDGRDGFDADLAAALPRAAHRVAEASRLMDCPGDWLVTVLRWAQSR